MNTHTRLIQNFILGLSFVCIFFGLQVNAEDVSSNDIEVTVTPANPEPYQDVTIDVESLATNMNNASIEWVDGKRVVLSGVGKTRYTTKTGGPDSPTNITVSIIPANSTGKIVKKITIYSSDIEVFWEAVDGYTPPFYRGKSFSSSEGRIKAVAIPNTTVGKGKTGNISYEWKQNDDTILGAGGYKKDFVIFQNDVLNSNESITVNASSTDGLYNASKKISIPIVEPKILFYKKSPSEGILFNQILVDDSTVEDETMTIVALPYFLNIKGKESSYQFSWMINGEEIETPQAQRELTIKPESRGGSVGIGITIEGLDSLFQKITNRITLNI